MTIRVLSPEVATAIAAGEMVERPVSVVKELIENALDAGATVINVELLQGGIAQLRVSDNGSGIPAGEVELAFARHATSKLARMEDLECINTMGFRGEALPSIAAAGRVTMVTRPLAAHAATSIELTLGEITRFTSEGAAPGTTVTVDDLFAGLPARRKYLRSPNAEASRVRKMVSSFALSSPKVRFLLNSNGRTLLRTTGGGVLRNAVAAVYGTEIASLMLEMVKSPGPYQVSGLVSPAGIHRPNRAGMNLFVNSRIIQHRPLAIAIEEAYRGFLMEGRFPIVTLFLDVPPTEVDVNVHPTKREIRFLREGDAFSTTQQAVRETLLTESFAMELGGRNRASQFFLNQGAMDISSPSPSFSFTIPAMTGVNLLDMPTQPSSDGEAERSLLTRHNSDRLEPNARMPVLRVVGQVANTYLIAEDDVGMFLFDQHAAHEQVLFDRLLRQWTAGQPEIQPLLDPLPIELTPEQTDTMRNALPMLGHLGFQVELFGEGTWLIRAVPAIARQAPIARLVSELLVPSRHSSLADSPTHYAMAASIACHSAVRAGQALNHQQIIALIEALEGTANSHHCPHGRPTSIRLSISMLEREFGRV